MSAGCNHSDDAGRSFARQAVPNDAPCAFGRLAFTDADHVWLVGTNRIVRSSDDGATWTDAEQPLPIPAYAALNDVFTDPTHGFIAASDSDGTTSRGVLLATDDGGQTWRRALEAPGIFRSLDFVDHDHGYLAGGTPAEGEIWATTDGGQTWEQRATLDSRDVQVVSFVDPEHGYGAVSNRPCSSPRPMPGERGAKTPVGGASRTCEPDSEDPGSPMRLRL